MAFYLILEGIQIPTRSISLIQIRNDNSLPEVRIIAERVRCPDLGGGRSGRAARIFRYIEERKKVPEVILLRNGLDPHLDHSFFYLSGLGSGLFEGCSLLSYPDGRRVLLTSRLEEESARREGRGMKIVAFRDEKDHFRILHRYIGRHDRMGINAKELTYSSFLSLRKEFPEGRFMDVSREVMRARSIKDEEEIRLLRRSAGIATRAFSTLGDVLREGVTETEVAAHLNSTMERLGASGPSFDTIVAFGPNSAEPHYSPRGRRLRARDYALFDFGARFRRYCSDMTRTVLLGEASAEKRRIYETVLEAQGIGIDALRVGEKASEVHKRVARFIDSTDYRGRFIHSLGHTIGLSVHDGASLSAKSEILLEEGMVFTVEPGIYIPKLGGVRIEDDLVVRKKRAEALTKAPKELLLA